MKPIPIYVLYADLGVRPTRPIVPAPTCRFSSSLYLSQLWHWCWRWWHLQWHDFSLCVSFFRYGVCSCPSPLVIQGNVCVEKEAQVWEYQCFFSPQFINHHHLTTLPMVSYHVIITISSQSIMITIDRSLACVLLQGIATKALTVSIIGREGITGDGEGTSCLWW